MYMGEMRNLMLDAGGRGTTPSVHITHVGLLVADNEKSGFKDIKDGHTLELAAHGYSTGDLVEIVSITGGSDLVKTGHFFYVKVVSSSRIELSQTATFVQETWTVEVTACTLRRLTEHPAGATYKRETVSMAAPSRATIEDATTKNIPIDTGLVVDAVGLWYHTTTEPRKGTLLICEKVAKETIGGTKTYVVSDTKDDLLSE